VLQRMERQLEGRAVLTELSENLPMVFVDDVLFGQVLWNLLENSAKYTAPGSPLDLVAFENDGAVTVEVRDRGPGVPPGEEERIFEKFYRGQSTGARGAGLGLPICRAIVQAHRGTIQALARTGGGAIFRIRLPIESR
jgi:two-component system, OmpR family, sensor histidine kinase KdpD